MEIEIVNCVFQRYIPQFAASFGADGEEPETGILWLAAERKHFRRIQTPGRPGLETKS